MSEVTVYGFLTAEQDIRPIAAVRNTDGSYSLQVTVPSGANEFVSQQISFTDRSGTLGAASVAQQIMAANLSRRYLLVQNVSSGSLWINFNANANLNQPSILLAADGGSFVMEGSAIVTDSVSVIGATLGQAYTAKEA
jgi:hypothetical protein